MAFTSNQALMVVYSGNNLHIKPETLNLKEEDLKLIKDQIVDFKSFKVKEYPLKDYFEAHGLLDFFDLLNGPTFPYLVKDFWVRDKVFNEGAVAIEEIQNIAEIKDFKGKSIGIKWVWRSSRWRKSNMMWWG